MKKLLSIVAISVLLTQAIFAAPKQKKAEPQPPASPIELIFGEDYAIEPAWGNDYFTIDGTSIHFNKGSKNNNHATLFRLFNTDILAKGAVIEIEYEMISYDPNLACQVVIQPASDSNADFNKQDYPIVYNNFEPDAPKVFTVDCDNLLKSSVKKSLSGFRIVNNEGSYEKYKWQGDWEFKITKVTYKAK